MEPFIRKEPNKIGVAITFFLLAAIITFAVLSFISGKASVAIFALKHPELINVVRSEYEAEHKRADQEIMNRQKIQPVATESAEKKE